MWDKLSTVNPIGRILGKICLRGNCRVYFRGITGSLVLQSSPLSSPTPSFATMGLVHQKFLSDIRVFGCSKCHTHLATMSSMLSRVSHIILQGWWLGACLILVHLHRLSPVSMGEHIFLTSCRCLRSPCHPLSSKTSPISSVNIELGEPADRNMTTGLHTVRDIYCNKCGTTLGWKYVSCSPPIQSAPMLIQNHSSKDKAHVESQRYKEGKYILERGLICDVED